MDRKAILILVVSGALLVCWIMLTNRLFPPQPIPASELAVAATTNTETATNRPVTVAPTLEPAPSGVPGASWVRPATAERLVTVETAETRYIFTSHGGGLKRVELKHYPEAVSRAGRKLTNEVAVLNDDAPVPAFVLLGGDTLLGQGDYEISKTDTGVRAEQKLPSGLRVVKEFVPGADYLLHISLRLENTTNQSLSLPAHEWVTGTATPISVQDQSRMMGMMWFNGAKAETANEAWFANRSLGCLPGSPRKFFRAGSNNVAWASVQNQFFALATIPATNQPVLQVTARRVDLPPPSEAELAVSPNAVAKPVGFQASFVYPAVVLGAGQALERQYHVFAGPKEYRTLDRLAGRFGNQIDLVMNFGFFGFFAKALLLSMNGLHGLGLAYGLAIVVITVIIKLVFWPLTQASTRSMKRMATLQPQIKAIQEKYKDEPMKAQKKVHEYMREHKINPAAGCLPILIQLPIFFGFYTMLQSAIELRGASFLWAFDLSQPDTVGHLFGIAINPLPLIMGATQLWQTRLTPPSPGVDPVQQKMMQYMPLIFLFILYGMSSGLTLYWTVQNLLSIAQMKLTRSADSATSKAPAAPPIPPKRKH
jgi:YidC/Oxa1 family membrane protein insertase